MHIGRLKMIKHQSSSNAFADLNRLIEEIDCRNSGPPLADYHHKMANRMNHMHFSYEAAIFDKLTPESFIFCH